MYTHTKGRELPHHITSISRYTQDSLLDSKSSGPPSPSPAAGGSGNVGTHCEKNTECIVLFCFFYDSIERGGGGSAGYWMCV